MNEGQICFEFGAKNTQLRSHLRLWKVVEEADDLESALAEEPVPLVAVVAHAHQVPGLVEVLL